MREPGRFHNRTPFVLSLLVLVANVVAPFRTSSGRALIDAYGHHAPRHSAPHVRPRFQTVPSHCFRAVVGLARGDWEHAPAPAVVPVPVAAPSSPTRAFSDAL
ncbi:MAG: hypothetical protein ACP5XB_29830, partial [Isosphaeraceae bacterium]